MPLWNLSKAPPALGLSRKSFQSKILRVSPRGVKRLILIHIHNSITVNIHPSVFTQAFLVHQLLTQHHRLLGINDAVVVGVVLFFQHRHRPGPIDPVQENRLSILGRLERYRGSGGVAPRSNEASETKKPRKKSIGPI